VWGGGYKEGVKESDAETGPENHDSQLDCGRRGLVQFFRKSVFIGVSLAFMSTMRPFACAINTYEIIWR
jgi:hypothetical protein